jgi:hypothetical protein
MKLLFAKTAEGVKFYPITIAEGVVYKPATGSAMRLNEFLDSIDYSGKADKVSGATSGNFAGLDANGNLTDSGSKASDFQVAGDYKTTQTAVVSPTADGNSYAYIDTISQNANGEITATKKTIPDAAASTSGVGGTKGLMSAADKEAIDNLSTDLAAKADKVASATSGNFAGLDSNGNLTDSGSKASDFDAAGDAAAAEAAAKSYTDGLIAALDASESQTAGADGLALSITEVDGVITSISGSIAANTYDAYGDAAQALADAIGASSDASSANTIYGAKKYADEAVAAGLTSAMIYKGAVDGTTTTLPTEDYKRGWWYKVAVAGTYAGKVCQAGDSLVANKDYASGATAANDWDLIQGNVAVSDENASLTIGTAVKIAEVEGVEIHVTQVEDMTKIEAEACGDTSEYTDYSSLFTTPSAGE